ncbi:BQ2448_2684 [Microbotryum intermedium]|uniref:BQ2448_2684 protein n=1 Tax=Microbotryum intermedium TaxID=269621 RepID=A0A238FJ47_9BASI|nr:BQ2448_2684 [Microbotryum intermedium]
MIVMVVINVLFMISRFKYLGVTHYERRAKSPEMDRPPGKVFIPNHRTVGVFYIILAGIFSMGFDLDALEVYVYHLSMSQIPASTGGLLRFSFTTFLLTTNKYSGITASAYLVKFSFTSVFVFGRVMGIAAGSFHIFFAIVVGPTLIYLAVTFNTLTIVHGPWWIFETAEFIGLWSYAALLLLILNASHVPSPSRPGICHRLTV